MAELAYVGWHRARIAQVGAISHLSLDVRRSACHSGAEESVLSSSRSSGALSWNSEASAEREGADLLSIENHSIGPAQPGNPQRASSALTGQLRGPSRVAEPTRVRSDSLTGPSGDPAGRPLEEDRRGLDDAAAVKNSSSRPDASPDGGREGRGGEGQPHRDGAQQILKPGPRPSGKALLLLTFAKRYLAAFARVLIRESRRRIQFTLAARFQYDSVPNV